jgi:hypothetical protein
MDLRGIDDLTRRELFRELEVGSRLVFFECCISFLLLTLRRPGRIVLLREGQSGWVAGLPYTLVSLVFGWWGLPWGMIYTPLVVLTNLRGGRDVTAQVEALLLPGAQESVNITDLSS